MNRMGLSTFDSHESAIANLSPCPRETVIVPGSGAAEHAELEADGPWFACRVRTHDDANDRTRGDRLEPVLEVQICGHLEAVELADDLAHLK